MCIQEAMESPAFLPHIWDKIYEIGEYFYVP